MIALAFDAYWIPVAITALSLAWLAWWTFSPSAWSGGLFYMPIYLLAGVALPAIPTLAAWLVWAVLT